MKKETTPSRITNQVKKLCSRLTIYGSYPKYIDVMPWENSVKNECINNVKRYIDVYEGQVVTGWVIWQWANILIEAEAHAIWKSPKGQLLDISVHDNNETKILFLEAKLNFNGYINLSHRQALTKSKAVQEFIELCNRRDKITSRVPVGTKVSIPMDLCARIEYWLYIFNLPAKKNDLCPCKSGLRYNKCCGKHT